MFGFFRRKTEREKFVIQQHRLLDFRICESEEVKVAPKRDEQVHAAIKILGDLIAEENFCTKGWESGWPRSAELLRSRSSDNWQSRISIYCEIDLGGANWDRLSAPKFRIEFEADGFLDEDGDDDVDAYFEKDRITLASIEKVMNTAIERERKFLAQFLDIT